MQKTKVEKHFDMVAGDYDFYKKKNSFYYDNLKKLLKSLIPAHKNVLEIGCGTGDLLNYLRPKYGYGYDISSQMVSISKFKFQNSKNLTFSTDFPTINNQQSTIYDFIFMSDVIEHLNNPKRMFRCINALMHDNSKLIITMANPIWEPVLMIAEKLGLKMPEGPHKRVAFDDLEKMIKECRLKIIEHDYKLLIPIKIPIITDFVNKHLEKYFRKLAFIEYFVVRI